MTREEILSKQSCIWINEEVEMVDEESFVSYKDCLQTMKENAQQEVNKALQAASENAELIDTDDYQGMV